MSVENFRKAIAASGVQKNGLKWRPIWLRKYAAFPGAEQAETVAVSAELAID